MKIFWYLVAILDFRYLSTLCSFPFFIFVNLMLTSPWYTFCLLSSISFNFVGLILNFCYPFSFVSWRIAPSVLLQCIHIPLTLRFPVVISLTRLGFVSIVRQLTWYFLQLSQHHFFEQVLTDWKCRLLCWIYIYTALCLWALLRSSDVFVHFCVAILQYSSREVCHFFFFEIPITVHVNFQML